MDSFTIDNAKPSNMSHNTQNTNVRQAKNHVIVHPWSERRLPTKQGSRGLMLLDLWPGPHYSLAITCVIDLPGPPMVEQCVQSWTEKGKLPEVRGV